MQQQPLDPQNEGNPNPKKTEPWFGSVWFRLFFQFDEPDFQTLDVIMEYWNGPHPTHWQSH